MSTQTQIKRIAILTSGGDAPGMNAAIRAAARAALDRGIEVYGVYEGYQGLIDGNMALYKSPRELCNIINKSGTYLYTARCDDFKTPEGMAKVLKTCKDKEIGGVIAIGGDGTFRGATDLSKHGIPTIGIPGTIDNDITSTDVTIGFDTAMNTAMNMIDNLRDTCESHARCNVIEVMGRWSGNIALRTGIASGASVIAIPEIPFDEDAAIKKIIAQKEQGKRSFIVVVSEGLVDYAGKLAKTIQAKTGIETKFAKFAHIQRGGKPTLQDRLLASELGYTAIQYLLEGKSDIVICKEDGKIGYKNISEALLVDRMFKKKMTAEEYAALSAEDKEWMEARCAKLLADIQRLYDIANNIC